MKVLSFFAILFLSLTGWGQPGGGNSLQFDGHFVFQLYYTDQRMMVRQESAYLVPDTRIDDIRRVMQDTVMSHLKDPRPLSPMLLGVKFNPAPALPDLITAKVPNFSKSYTSYRLPPGSEAVIVAMGIDESNIADYRYRVVLNDSVEIVPWSDIPGLEMRYGAKKPYGSIGTFAYAGQRMLVEVTHRKVYGIRDGYVIDWSEKRKAGVDQVIAEGASKYGYYNPAYEINGKRADSAASPPVDWNFVKDSVRSISVYVTPAETIPYSVYLIRQHAKGADTTMVEWYFHNKRFFRVEADQIERPGRYEIVIQPLGALGKYPEQDITRIPFYIREAKPVSVTFTMGEVLSCLGVVIVAFILYRGYHRNRLARIDRQRQQIGIRLQSIRGQLNPHFLFNAITSIQNLVQKNEVETAGHYLTTFASLTRAVLASGEKDMNSLSEEIGLLDDYLRMEQLRFGFSFEILETLGINSDLVEIPPLLLQPLAENAVKHGVARLREKGHISVRISHMEDTLILEVEDNGNGFEATAVDMPRGYGIRLTRERLELLNQMFPGQPFTLSFIRLPQGMRAVIEISHWLSL